MVLRRFESLRRFSTSFKNVTPGRAFLNPRNAKKARNSVLFSYLHHFWQVNLAGAEGLSLACRLGCCSLVGSAQHRPRREPRPVRSRAPLALAHPSARGFRVGVGKRTGERGRASVGRFLPQVTKRAVLGWCCEEISGPKGRENPGKAGNTLTRIDKDRIIKVPGLLPAGRLLQTGG